MELYTKKVSIRPITIIDIIPFSKTNLAIKKLFIFLNFVFNLFIDAGILSIKHNTKNF